MDSREKEVLEMECSGGWINKGKGGGGEGWRTVMAVEGRQETIRIDGDG